MLRIALMVTLFAFGVGCASKKAKTEIDTPIVSTEPMNFDPQGSDSKKIVGLTTIHFDFDRANLSTDNKSALLKNLFWLKEHKAVVLQIEGHCDDRGSIEYNLSLGERRAKVVYNYLVKEGANPKQLTTISYGKEKPILTEDTDEARAINRRVNFVPIVTK